MKRYIEERQKAKENKDVSFDTLDHYQKKIRETISFSTEGCEFEIQADWKAMMGTCFTIGYKNAQGCYGFAGARLGFEVGEIIEQVIQYGKPMPDSDYEEPSLFDEIS